MKHALLLLALTLASHFACAQSSDSVSYEAVLIHYNAYWQVTKPESAVVKRLAYLPTKLKHIKNLRAPQFRFAVTDYYADNKVLAKGHYDEHGRKWSKWLFYHNNGQIDCEGLFFDNKPSGVWKFWTLQGEPHMEVVYEGEAMRLLNYWSPNREQLVKDGNGTYTVILPSNSKLEGAVVNGFQTGTWRILDPNGQVEFEQVYSPAGELLTGTAYKNGKPVKTHADEKGNNPIIIPHKEGLKDIMTIQAAPDYMDMMEAWPLDYKIYEAKYPVIADLLKAKVEKVLVAPQKLGLASPKEEMPWEHYFKITQRFDDGTSDAFVHAVPVVMPAFGKGDADLQNYILKNFKFPRTSGYFTKSGLLVMEFTVNAKGEVQNPKVVKGITSKIDAEAIRFLSAMPVWKPGNKLGEPVDVSMVLPLRFNY